MSATRRPGRLPLPWHLQLNRSLLLAVPWSDVAPFVDIGISIAARWRREFSLVFHTRVYYEAFPGANDRRPGVSWLQLAALGRRRLPTNRQPNTQSVRQEAARADAVAGLRQEPDGYDIGRAANGRRAAAKVGSERQRLSMSLFYYLCGGTARRHQQGAAQLSAGDRGTLRIASSPERC